MPKLDRPQDVVQRLRGHWRRSLSEPLWGRSAILAVNRVLDDETEARLPHRLDWCLGPDSFRQLLDSLSEITQLVSLDSALQLHHDPRPRIALTFDGGWRDIATQVVPALERLALPASVFLPSASLQSPWIPYWAAIGEALWQGRSTATLTALLGDNGLPLPPAPPAIRDERASQAIRDYLHTLASTSDALLKRLADELWRETLPQEMGLDAFSIRRLEQGGLLRFGHLAELSSLASNPDARRQLQASRHRLDKLCREPLAAIACTDTEACDRLDRFAKFGDATHWLTRTPGWLEPPLDTSMLPRFVISQPLASSPGRLFDWLLGHLPV